MEKIQFSLLPISDEIKKAVSEMGFEEATAIQTQSIPLILDGEDVIGYSQTGTGKTAAFGIPVIERVNMSVRNSTQALILCPTRELAVQACEEFRKFAKYKHGVSILPIYGGQPIDRQIRSLRNGATIVIGTPGRVMDHMRRHTLKLENLSMIVLDEADEMLNMGFREDIETILQDAPEDRQTILFSATMPPEIMKLTKQYQTDPKLVKITHQKLTVPNIEQVYYEVPSARKIDALVRLLDFYNPNRSIVFCNTKRMVDQLVSELQVRGYSPDGLHGDMKQQVRTNVMNAFRSGRSDILVATDVAARGIDVNDVDAVFNFDIPQDEEYYVHRIGRTGRAGKEGTAYTFVSGRRQIYELRNIQRYTKSKIEMRQLPSVNEIEEIRNTKLINEVIEKLKENKFSKYESIVDKLMENDFTSVEIACALLQMMDNTTEIKEIEIKPERVDIKKRSRNSNKDSNERNQKRASRPTEKDMTRLIINVGKKDRVAANHILAAVAGESGLPGKIVGAIDIYDKYTFVDVPTKEAQFIIESMDGCKINGRKSSTEMVKNRKRRRR